ncbi:hypothetical protein GCM10022253_11560 [Sphingomonas endophytica]
MPGKLRISCVTRCCNARGADFGRGGAGGGTATETIGGGGAAGISVDPAPAPQPAINSDQPITDDRCANVVFPMPAAVTPA